jgi:hypothetical protein
MKIYCQKCGTGIEYSYEKPNFCFKCGTSFSAVKVSAAKTVTPRTPIITQEEEDAESVDALDTIKNMSKLDVELSSAPDRKSKIKDIMGTRSESFREEGQQSQPINKKEFLESFKKEAGFYPSKNDIDEEN